MVEDKVIREVIICLIFFFIYDTNDKDLARDFKDFISELDFEVTMIPLSPDFGKTLQSKEEHYFESVDGTIFLITPGSIGAEKHFPLLALQMKWGRRNKNLSKSRRG